MHARCKSVDTFVNASSKRVLMKRSKSAAVAGMMYGGKSIAGVRPLHNRCRDYYRFQERRRGVRELIIDPELADGLDIIELRILAPSRRGSLAVLYRAVHPHARPSQRTPSRQKQQCGSDPHQSLTALDS